jgi:hypothetical protein
MEMKRDMAIGFDRVCQLPIRYLKFSLQRGSMTDDVEKSYKNLFTEISEHDEWEYSDLNSYSIQELAERSVDNLGPEAVYDSTNTEGQISLGPKRQSNVIGRLTQPLADLDVNPQEGTFAARVAETYKSISADYIDESQYLKESSLDKNPLDVLVLDIPTNPDLEELDNALDAAGEASQEVQKLHDEINQTLASRIDS